MRDVHARAGEGGGGVEAVPPLMQQLRKRLAGWRPAFFVQYRSQHAALQCARERDNNTPYTHCESVWDCVRAAMRRSLCV